MRYREMRGTTISGLPSLDSETMKEWESKLGMVERTRT
jgi:hypothetical protein